MVNSKLKVREEIEQGKQTRLNSIIATGIPFRVEVKEKVLARKKKNTKETRRGTKTKSGHVKCKICGQWKHVKCTGKTFTELKHKGYTCPKCKGTKK